MNLEGRVYKIQDEQIISEKFKLRKLVIEQSGEYPQFIEVQFTQDRCDLLSAFNVGDEVNISINLKGRLWTGNDGVEKCFNTLEGWKIEKGAAAVEQPNSMDGITSEDEGDLVF